ncbi:MAG: ribosomal protein S18-alanine N-acetyltransferase [Leptolyngbyaceae cyanobacterium]
MRVTCRSVMIQDLANVVALDHRCFGGLWSEAAYSREVDSPNSDLLVLATPVNGLAELIGIGCLWAILDEAHITLLGIAPAYQRRGLGRWLLIQLLKCAIARGLTHATLEVRQSNQAALGLYSAFGFRIAGERRRYYTDGETALILWRNELQTPEFAAELQTAEQWLTVEFEAVLCSPAISATPHQGGRCPPYNVKRKQ